ncbi:hypothetical protein ACFLZX_02790 [Nanoarchaeota archaeon]
MDKRNLRAQSAMEFLVLAGILLFILLVMLAVVSHQTSIVNQNRDTIVVEDIVAKIQKEINLAARVSDGYSRSFYLPSKVGKLDYSINIIGGEVIIDTGGQTYSRKVPPVVGNITKGNNVIRKNNETIYIN